MMKIGNVDFQGNISINGVTFPSERLQRMLSDSVLWKNDKSYETGDFVFYGNRLYYSLDDSNKGNEPQVSPRWWAAYDTDSLGTSSGHSSYLYVAYAEDDKGTKFSLIPNESRPYMAFLISEKYIVKPNENDFVGVPWVKYIGRDGTGDWNPKSSVISIEKIYYDGNTGEYRIPSLFCPIVGLSDPSGKYYPLAEGECTLESDGVHLVLKNYFSTSSFEDGWKAYVVAAGKPGKSTADAGMYAAEALKASKDSEKLLKASKIESEKLSKSLDKADDTLKGLLYHTEAARKSATCLGVMSKDAPEKPFDGLIWIHDEKCTVPKIIAGVMAPGVVVNDASGLDPIPDFTILIK